MAEWFLIQERFKNSLFPVYLIIEVMTREMKALSGQPLHKCIMIHRGPHIQYWFQTQKWAELQRACFQAVLKNPRLLSQLEKRLRKKAPGFLKFVRRVSDSGLESKTNRQLWELYNQYCREYKKIGLLGEPLAISTKDALADQMETRLRLKLTEKGAEKKFSEFFSELVSPVVPSFASAEELELMEIAVKAKGMGLKSVQADLAVHAEKFFWLPYDYEGETWGKDYFESVVNELIQKPLPELKKQFRNQKNKWKRLAARQERIVSETGMDRRTKELFAALRKASVLMDFKKEVFTQSHWYKNSLMKEIAKRLGIVFSQTYFLLPIEVKSGLLEKKLDKQAIETRSNFCVSIVQNGKTKIETGEIARQWEQKMQAQTNQVAESDWIELHGTCASPGSAIGKARVILTEDKISEMETGEILVTQATTPDFVPAMKKAKAIVTNEGGITSHAAIVSRELGIPCIVGTPNATRLIRTGDLLDVHAGSGTIKKIKTGETK